MLDVIGQCLFFSFLPLALALFVATLYRLRHLNAVRRSIIAFLFSTAFAVILTAAWVSILLRDGLAPGMVPSEGWLALRRSLPLAGAGLLVGILLAGIAAFLLRFRRDHKDA